jgi:putative tricarboxylic transport membrane protein
MKRVFALLVLMSCFSLSIAFSEGAQEEAAASGFVPDKPVEIVVGSSPGGGAERFARMISDTAYKYKYISQPMKVNFQTGATGNIAFNYVRNKKADRYTIMGSVTSYDVAAILNDSPIKIGDMGALGIMAFAELVLCVNKNSPWRTVEDLFAAMKKDPKMTFSGGLTGAMEEVGFRMFCAAADVTGSYVGFDGQSQAVTALLGGHIDVGILIPGTAKGLVESGDLIALASLSETALGGVYAGVPTMKALGYDVVASVGRCVLCSPEMPADAVAFYEDMLKKIWETPEFKEYVAKNGVTPYYLNAADAIAWLVKNSEDITNVLKEAGVLN